MNIETRNKMKRMKVNYPSNTWWVAGFSSEITREPIGRWILDKPVLLYRTQNGDPVALDDRCPHRWAPLSKGRVVGDDIECPYHGITFGPDGHCVRIPSQKAIVADCLVHSYPLIESGPFVWIWMGDPERIEEYDPPQDLGWANSADWSVATGAMEWNGNYLLLHDNVVDLTHFNFLHRNTLAQDDWLKPPKVTTTKTTVTFRQEFIDRQLKPFHTSATRTAPDRPASRFITEGIWFSPALHTAAEFIEFDDAVPGERDKFTFRVAHATTPISMDRYRYYFIVGWDVDLPDDVKAAMGPGAAVIFEEDRAMIEAVSEMVAQDSRGTDYPELKLQADTPQLHMRQKVKELMARE
tara:strand:- start:1177 stop:2235 length:1059 start_codon:yes stop_codon:yes gene_type:complete